MMQIGSEQLKAQQQIMQSKNIYNGKIDGIWGPKTISAKQKWERSGKFAPAIPNNGFPLDERGPFPAGVKRLPSGLLTCTELLAEQQKAGSDVEAPKVQQNPQHNQNQNRNQNKGGNQNQQGQNRGQQTVHVSVPAAEVVEEAPAVAQ